MRTAFLLLLSGLAAAQPQYYPFPVLEDQLSGAPDFSFLNAPLEAKDRLFVRDGQFFRVGADLEPNTADDERVRLFGVNLSFGANFPAESDARRIAQRLRRLGVNLVRFHHMDTQPDSNQNNAGSVLTTGPYPTFNPVAMARLRVFLDALSAEGIYANINLHVGYRFRPSTDKIPDFPGGDSAFPTQSKPLHILHPRLVELQGEFTRELLRRLRLDGDPMLAMVEVNNESSLLYAWQAGSLDAVLLGDYRWAMEFLWNEHLRAAYPTTDTLRAAWGASEPAGPELLPGRWQPLEVHSPSVARMETADAEDGLAVVKVTVERAGAPVILKQIGFSVDTRTAYTIEVEMRADLPAGQARNVYWDVKQDVNPWRTVTSRTVQVSSQWQKYRMAATPAFEMTGIGRFGLSVENVGVPVYVRGATLRAGAKRGLEPNETLAEGNIALVGSADSGTDARTNDYLKFLAERDKNYLNSLQAATREVVGPLVPVAGTQMGYGGLLNIDSHANTNYFDEHFYIDHYAFPNVSWDGRDWRFRDSSSLGTGLATFLDVAAARVAGKPYTVSEFNQPWPNTFAAELNPTLAAFGAFQDWDSIMHFAYAHSRNWDDGVPNGFNITGDWTKYPNIGQSAWLFRSGAVATGKTPVDLPVPPAARLRATREKRNGNFGQFLAAAGGYTDATAFRHPVRLRPDLDEPLAAEAKLPAGDVLVTDTEEMTYRPAERLLLLHARRAAGVFGFVEKKRVTAGPIDVELAPGARGFVALLLTPLDGQPIESSRHLLVSNPGHTLRSQPGTAPPRPQQLVPYTSGWWTLEPEPGLNKPSGNLNGGQKPVWMERVEAIVTLRTNALKLTVFPLNGGGGREQPLGAEHVQKIDGGFRLLLQGEGQYLSPWFELVVED